MGNEIKQYFKKIALSFLCATVVFEGVAASSLPVLAYDDETTLFDAEEYEYDSEEVLVEDQSDFSAEEYCDYNDEDAEILIEGTEGSDYSARVCSTGKCGDDVKWKFDPMTGELYVYGNGAINDYESSAKTPWQDYRAAVQKIVIEDGITYVGNNAFSNMENATELVISDTVKAIGHHSFSGIDLDHADEYVIPDGIEALGSRAFYGTYLADEVVVPANVKVVEEKALSLDARTCKLTFLGDMPEFGKTPFWGSVYTVYYPGNNVTWKSEEVKRLDGENEVSFKAIDSEDIVQGKCGDEIFWEITGDEEKTLRLYGSGAMYDYSKTSRAPWSYYLYKKISKLVIDPGITSVGAYAFYGLDFCKTNDERNKIDLPDTIKSVGDYAFYSVDDRYIKLSDNIEIIGDSAFENAKLDSLGCMMPRKLKTIGNAAFRKTNLPSTIWMPDSLEAIGDEALNCYDKVRTVYFAGDLPALGSNIFASGKFIHVYFPEDNQTWKNASLVWKGPFENSDVSCSGIGYFNVTFVDPYGNEIVKKYVKGTKFEAPSISLNEGDEIMGWYSENTENPGYQTSSCRYSFSARRTSDIKLSARLKGADCKVRFVTYCDTTIPDQVLKAGEKIVCPETPYRENATFRGWSYDFDKEVTEDCVVYAYWDSIVSFGVGEKDVSYTGKPLYPVMEVYANNCKLLEGRDYTIKYSNNIRAGKGKYKITFKGNYKGTLENDFKISPASLSEENFDVGENRIYYPYDGKRHFPNPVIKSNISGKTVTLKKGVDYTCDYYVDPTDDDDDYIFRSPGVYYYTIEGKGNYQGSVWGSVVIGDYDDIPITSAKVSKPGKFAYTGEEVRPVVSVKYKGKLLEEGKDYTVAYENNINPGTAYIIIKAVTDTEYVGIKKIPFTIKGMDIAKAKVSGIEDQTYDGMAKCLEKLKLTIKAKNSSDIELKGMDEEQYLSIKDTDAARKIDYIFRYENNVNAGKAGLIITGVNGYSGICTKTYKINPTPVNSNLTTTIAEKAAYDKTGAIPEITVAFSVNGEERILTPGTDYMVSLKGNKKLGKASANITFKGNFKGTVTKTFEVVRSDFEEADVDASDVVFRDDAGINSPEIIITDKNGLKLEAGKDYSNSFVYRYAENTEVISSKDKSKIMRNKGDEVSSEDIVPCDTTLYAEVSGIGNYEGVALSKEFRVCKTLISSAKVTIVSQRFNTRGPVTLHKKAIKVTVNDKELTADDYDIVGYENNDKAGKAVVILKGKGSYGGVKRATFIIKNYSFGK
ncbi:leucine-rich repeat domain-containing protein [Butyrivibrio sp. DSM 10294]|uniref:leucine-rich repeat domain-containing protein n=1 Tax=Butyrivibrio sp. DSM 10294 TaxID=2972457 RepID=UPI00234F500B|nr:leucine-rich repeat domain-containing protein [Butyrivibrio sp. DSM 10294]MDC7294858.1 leucine-rich repeat domain-containing protein [Butyrivibrio sp. DSM 10294]